MASVQERVIDLAAENAQEQAIGLAPVSDRAIDPAGTLIATQQIGIARDMGTAYAITTAIIPVAYPPMALASGVTIRMLGGT